MPHLAKRLAQLEKKVDFHKEYDIEEAVELISKVQSCKFPETVELHFNLGVDPKRQDQQVRSSVTLPHGTGKKIRILAFAKGQKAQEAKAAGADYVGDKDLIEKIEKGWLEFEYVVATGDMMKDVSRLGRILGPRGLMPNKKDGTLTDDLKGIIEELKKGRVSYKCDQTGNLHFAIGKTNYSPKELLENFNAVLTSVLRAKPPAFKGTYIKSIYLSTTMGRSLKISTKIIHKLLAKRI